VLKVAADSREVTPWKVARCTLTSHVDVEPPMGVRHYVKHNGGGSQPEERHALVGDVLRICRRRKARYGGF
jgi:hypothetical protein